MRPPGSNPPRTPLQARPATRIFALSRTYPDDKTMNEMQGLVSAAYEAQAEAGEAQARRMGAQAEKRRTVEEIVRDLVEMARIDPDIAAANTDAERYAEARKLANSERDIGAGRLRLFRRVLAPRVDPHCLRNVRGSHIVPRAESTLDGCPRRRSIEDHAASRRPRNGRTVRRRPCGVPLRGATRSRQGFPRPALKRHTKHSRPFSGPVVKHKPTEVIR